MLHRVLDKIGQTAEAIDKNVSRSIPVILLSSLKDTTKVRNGAMVRKVSFRGYLTSWLSPSLLLQEGGETNQIPSCALLKEHATNPRVKE